MTPTGLETAKKPAARPLAIPDAALLAAEVRMLDALRNAEGSITEASARLGVHRTTLWRWMKLRGLRRADYRA